MKKIFLWFLFPMLATAQEIPAKAVTKEVTVFLSGAQITAESTVMIPKGNSTIIFNDLSTQIDQNSIQISGLKDASVLAILYSINYLDRKTQTAQIKKLEEDILNQRKLINKLENKIVGLDEEMSLLANNKKLSSEQQAVSMEKMLSFAKYYRERSEAIKNEQFETSLALNEARSLMNRFIQEKDKLEGANSEQRGQIMLKLDSQTAANLNLTLKYNVGAAGWVPNYEIKSQINQNNLQFLYKASVNQQTGDDWKDVKLTLSTGDPNVRNDKPTPLPQYLNFVYQYVPTATPVRAENFKYNPMVKRVSGTVLDSNGQALPGATVVVVGTNQGAQTDFDGKFTLNISQGQEIDFSYIGYKTQRLPIYAGQMNVNLMEDNTMLESVVVAQSNVVKKLSGKVSGIFVSDQKMKDEVVYTGTGEIKEQNQTAVIFKISKPYAIPSSNEPQMVQIDQFEIPAEYEYFAVPVLNESVFLTAKVKNWEQYDFLAGEATIYLEGSYAGKTFIDPFQTEEELIISLGVDPNVVVERKQTNLMKDKSFLGSTRIINKKYEITVRNNKNTAITLMLHDRIPVAQNKEIKVEKLVYADGKLDAEKGLIEWKLNLDSKQTVKKPIEYEVKFSKDKKINL